MFKRLSKPLISNSFFLFGARGTGKSTLLNQWFSKENSVFIDLLDPETEDLFSRHPNELTKKIDALTPSIQWVVIDEIQKIPSLLNIVHQQIEKTDKKFALTGSSARKLRRGAANLLAGRAFVYSLYPLTHLELSNSFDLKSILEWGSLPKIFKLIHSEEKAQFLRSYAHTYLKEEIQAEQLVRNVQPFRRFLEVAAQTNGQIINYSNIANDIGADAKTVQSYFQILEDTLMGYFLEPYHRSIRKRQSQKAKFYLFDLGIKRALDRTLTQEVLPQTYAYGKAFEHFIILEIFRLNSYFEKDFRFSYLRTKDDAEIDLIIERPGMPIALVEIKSTNFVQEKHTTRLSSFLQHRTFKGAEALCLSLDPQVKKFGKVHALPWQEGIKFLGLF